MTPAFSDDVWELYDRTVDNNLAKSQQLFLIEGARHNVVPLADRAAERMNPVLAHRPTLVQGETLRLYPGMTRLNEGVTISVKNRSFTVSGAIFAPDAALNGVIVTQGGRTGGWVVFVEDGRLAFH